MNEQSKTRLSCEPREDGPNKILWEISSERDAPSTLTLTSYGNLFQEFCDRRKLGGHATKFEKSSWNEFQKNENYLCIKPVLDA